MPANAPQIHPAIPSLLDSIRLGEPRIHGGIGLWPVLAEARSEPVYITLVEALSQEGFKITEVSEGGSVPELRVVNETAHHVLLFDGEELQGAKQNRILNTTMLVEAGSQVGVPVSCTEQGRWDYRSREFSPSGSLAYAELRKKKSAAVSMSLKMSANHAADQGEVWGEIEQLHQCADTADSSQTRAMRDAYEGSHREIEEFAASVPLLDGQCGLLAVIGERVEGIDVLSRPEAYRRIHRRLAESHAMDFLVRKRGRATMAADPEAPARFLAEAAKATESVHKAPGLGDDHRLGFRWGHGAALRVEETIVHLALFGGRGSREGHHPTEPPLHRRRRH
jgi:hypothetical protein